MGLDPAVRKAIMKEALGIDKVSSTRADPITGEEPVVETKPILGDENKIYEYRKQLKKIHLFEKRIKKDSEEWGEEDWDAFEASLKEAVTAENSGDIMAQVLENKKKNITDEAKILHETRVQAIAKMDFSLFEKLL